MGCISSSEGDAGADPSSLDATTSGRWQTQVDVGTDLEFGNYVRTSLGRLETRTHPLDKYDVLEKLGTGGFAVVSRIRLCGNAVHAELEDVDVKNEYAMKVVQASFGEGVADKGREEEHGDAAAGGTLGRRRKGEVCMSVEEARPDTLYRCNRPKNPRTSQAPRHDSSHVCKAATWRW